MHACVRASVTSFDACHILWIVHARILKFHIWIPHGKIADLYFFFPELCPFLELCPYEKVRMKFWIETWSADRGWWVDYLINFPRATSGFIYLSLFGLLEYLVRLLTLILEITAKILTQGYWYHKLRKVFQNSTDATTTWSQTLIRDSCLCLNKNSSRNLTFIMT